MWLWLSMFLLEPGSNNAQWLPKWKRKIVVADLTNPIISAGQGLISAGLTSQWREYVWFFLYKALTRAQDCFKVALIEPLDAEIYYVYDLAGFSCSRVSTATAGIG